MSDTLLEVDNLHAEVEGNKILNGVDLSIPRGQIHAVMGPNGSGKSTLANVLMGHPGYQVTAGRILFRGQDVTGAAPDERARLGMFLAFQYPVEVPGVSVMNFLRSAMGAVRGESVPVREFRARIAGELDKLGMDMSFARRNVNEGFSGGEKKRNEVLQLSLLRPELAILDETDSGLDIDGITQVARAVNELRETSEVGVLIITHYMRILNYMTPDRVHVLFGGQVVKSGGPAVAEELEQTGYRAIRAEHGGPRDAAEAAR